MLWAPVSHHNKHNCSGSVAQITSHQLPPLTLQKAFTFPGWTSGMNHRSSSPNSVQNQLGFPFLRIRWVYICQSVWPVRWEQVSPFPSPKSSRKEHSPSYIATAVSASIPSSFLPPESQEFPAISFSASFFCTSKPGLLMLAPQDCRKHWNSALTSYIQHALTL